MTELIVAMCLLSTLCVITGFKAIQFLDSSDDIDPLSLLAGFLTAAATVALGLALAAEVKRRDALAVSQSIHIDTPAAAPVAEKPPSK